MIKPTRFGILALLLLTSAFATTWTYASHKYDCFNIGPCVGDIDFWIGIGNVASYLFLASWAVLLISTGLYSFHATGVRAKIFAAVAALVPLAVVFATHWLFNLGVSVAPA